VTDRGPLPSWRPGPTRDAIVAFLDSADSVPVSERAAYFDNDGTLWCERPSYVQLQFFLDELRQRAVDDPSIAERPEFAAVLSEDRAAIADIGMVRIALALAGLFEGFTPAGFSARAAHFMANAVHASLGRPLRTTVYQPMLELIDELRKREFTVGVVTGGGTEFVRAVSGDLYGVPSELVVGTLIDYELEPGPTLRRTARILGKANEGAAKVTNIQTQLGRAPILAAGNSGGDREMLEWATAGEHPGLAILVDHDDAEREFAYRSEAETFTEVEPITAVAERLGWLTVSMVRDWGKVFAPEA
jgi:phosphoserine phosphatase